MKKIFVLWIVIIAICLVVTSCDLFVKGGTIKITNDLKQAYQLRILFDGETVRFNDGQTSIQPSQTVTVSSNVDTSYVIYSGSNRLWDGRLEGGETITYKFSDLN